MKLESGKRYWFYPTNYKDIRVVRRFTEMQELTPEIVATLIDRVEVGQAQVVDGVKKQEIKIIYNFIGNIQE